MATAVRHPHFGRKAHPEFDVELSKRALGYNLPQRIGRLLWLPMLLMAIMTFAAGIVFAGIRADEIAGAGDPERIATYKHLVAGFMFIGFASVFAAISFAIARILGVFRKGGGEAQEAAGRTVRTLKMPVTARLFLALMIMAMMAILVAVGLHFGFATGISNTPSSLRDAEQRFVVLEAVRRIGVAAYLLAITLGLAAIIQVLRFQAIRIRQLPEELPGS